MDTTREPDDRTAADAGVAPDMDASTDVDTGPDVATAPDVVKEAAELAASAARLAKVKAELEDELDRDFVPKKVREVLPEGQPFEVPGPLA